MKIKTYQELKKDYKTTLFVSSIAYYLFLFIGAICSAFSVVTMIIAFFIALIGFIGICSTSLIILQMENRIIAQQLKQIQDNIIILRQEVYRRK